MARTLADDILNGFRSGDLDATKDALAWAVDRAAHRMAESNRQRLTDLWHTLSGIHYKVERLPLSPDMAEQRGYLEAIVHLTHAVRDLSDDLEAIQKVRSCAQGPAIVRKIKEEGTVRHGALAQSLGISAPSLTQAIGALADSGTLTATVHGKFKYYSLTPLGSLVARNLEGATTLAESIASMKRAIERSNAWTSIGPADSLQPDQENTGEPPTLHAVEVEESRLSNLLVDRIIEKIRSSVPFLSVQGGDAISGFLSGIGPSELARVDREGNVPAEIEPLGELGEQSIGKTLEAIFLRTNNRGKGVLP